MKFLRSNIAILIVAVILGSLVGSFLPEKGMEVVLVLKHICGQWMLFMVPLIIVGFVAPSIASLQDSVSRLILLALRLAYFSSIGAALFSAAASFQVIPLLSIPALTEGARALPDLLFRLDIPPVMNVISALALAILLGLGACWVKAREFTDLLMQFRDMVMLWVKHCLIPVLPLYVATNFCALAYQGTLSRMGIFLPAILIMIVGHALWLTLLYGTAAAVSRRNSLQIIRHYLQVYLTAVGTYSSAATLGVALEKAHRSGVLEKEKIDFAIPLYANIHLCGSVLSETFIVCMVSQLLYGHLPAVGTLILFVVLLGIFAIGAPGVPGGVVLASLGIVSSVLGFDDTGIALLVSIYTLQEGFGTGCNIVGDGALTLILQSLAGGKKSSSKQ